MKRMIAAAGVVLVAAMMTGCGGDVGKMLISNPDMQSKVMDAISSNSSLTGQMIDRLIGVDSTRSMLLDRIMSNGDATQAIMVNMAKNPTMVDGILGLAVQDSVMKSHVMTLLKGMQMAGAASR